MQEQLISGYRYGHSSLNHSHAYLLTAVLNILAQVERHDAVSGQGVRRLFDLGCGNGSVANALTEHGWDVTGVDPSVEGIAQAQLTYPHLKLQPGSAYDDLAARYGHFPIVLSLEVVEHVYAPRDYARTAFDLLERGGLRFSRPPITAIGRIWR